MAIEFKTTRVAFDPTRDREQKEMGSVNFSNPVVNAGLAINGFKLKYTDGDRPLWEEFVNVEETNMRINGSNVTFPVAILLRDSSGRIDDRFHGWVDVLVIAETKA